MATLSSQFPTLIDVVSRTDPDGRIADFANILSQSNEVNDDAIYIEGNLPTGHRSTIVTGLPQVYLRSVNAGVPRSKGTTVQVDDGAAMVEAFSNCDVDAVNLNGNSEAYRLSEDRLFIESMAQAQALYMFYGNPASDPRQYLGLSARYGLKSAGNGLNILDAGGTASANTSIWLICWGEHSVFCHYPKGSKAGLLFEDDGIITVYDTNNNPYKAYQSHYQSKAGLTVKDWRYAVRIANIDTATFAAMSGTQATTAVATNILHMMLRAVDRIPNFAGVRAAFYMNRSVYSLLRRLAMEKSVNALALEAGADQFGNAKKWASFEGIPLRKVDQLLNTEARVI